MLATTLPYVLSVMLTGVSVGCANVGAAFVAPAVVVGRGALALLAHAARTTPITSRGAARSFIRAAGLRRGPP